MKSSKKKPAAPADPGRAAAARKVEAMVRDTGISIPAAWAVVRGQKSLNEVLLHMAGQDKVSSLVSRHGVDKALATQVVKGQLDLDLVLRRKREKEHLAAHRTRDPMSLVAENGTIVRLYLHGLREVTGSIESANAFEFVLRSADESQRLHKLQVKLMFPASLSPVIGAVEGGRVVAEPVVKPQDRLALSDRRLFEAHDGGRPCRVETLEGDQLRGLVSWVGRYEFGLRQGNSAEVVVMRHALSRFTEE